MHVTHMCAPQHIHRTDTYETLVTKRGDTMQKDLEDRFKKSVLAAPDRILVATDLTDTGYLLPHIIAQAQTSGSQVTLIHVIPPSDLAAFDAEAAPYIVQAKLVRDARVMLLGVARQVESRGITCDTAVREGHVSEKIREEIGRVHATRLILGAHGRGKLGQFVLGSVAQEIIPSITIPIFLVGPHAHAAVGHATPRKILHPVSLMGNYQDSVNLALELAQTYKSELTFLHVLDPDVAEEVNPQRTIEWAKHALETLAPDGTNVVPPVRTLVTTGKLAQEILRVADETNADWIVLGANGVHRHWPFNDSAAYRVLATATRPVITLRHEPYRATKRKLEEVHFTSPM
jgi:nucleotide-binding universal stress UspA family protein